MTEVTDAEIAALRASGKFDEDWYLANYPDVQALQMDAAAHYLWLGHRLGRKPAADLESIDISKLESVELVVPKASGARYAWHDAICKRIDRNRLLISLAAARTGGYVNLTKFVFRVLRSQGIGGFRARLFRLKTEQAHVASFQTAVSHTGSQGRRRTLQISSDRYQTWLDVNQPSDSENTHLCLEIAGAGANAPLISVIMPVFHPPMQYLELAVRSVLSQTYEKWELCIHVDGDDNLELHYWLRGLAQSDKRIKLSIGQVNGGISVATNAAVRAAAGEFLAFFDQDDLLAPNALAKIAIASARNAEADILYTDDDKIDEAGRRYAPQFKPDWSPVLLLSYMYMSHLMVVRRRLYEELGGFRLGFEGSQDYDFALRAAEKARAVEHIPDVLYHWRAIAGSTAVSGDAKPQSFLVGARAVEEACSRRAISAKAVQPDWAHKAKVGIFKLKFGDTGPRVTIIIPTRDRLDLLRQCIDSVERLTGYLNYDILIIDNESTDPETLAYFSSCKHQVIRLASPNGRFSFAYLMNRAVEACAAEYVLLLNNDTVVRQRDWLSQMVGYAQMADVGAVGAKLYFPDDTIQHCGIVHGLYGGMAGPAFRNTPAHAHGYLAYTMVAREFSAVTAACLLTKRDLFLSVGGMDEKHFAVAYNDVDYCYRLVQEGYYCICCPDAELTHYEGKSRGSKDNLLELANFRARYRNFRDRWYNPNLSLDDEHFQIQPWRHVTSQRDGASLRIAMFSHNLNHEGAPNSMFELVTGLRAKGYVDPIVLSPEDGPLRKHYEQAGIPVYLVDHPLRDGHTPQAYAAKIEKLGATLRLAMTEAVYCNTAETFWAMDAARRAGLPSVWNIRESEPWDRYYINLPEFLADVAYESFYSAYRVVFVATSTRGLWSPLACRNNFAVIQNGLDLSRLNERAGGLTRVEARKRLRLTDEEVALVLVGTVCERKNQHVLLDGLSKAPVSLAKRVRVFIVGDRPNPYSTALHQRLADLPVEWRSRIEIVAETDRPYLYFLAADISLCTSLRESYPRVVLEAMALGLPLITTSVFGIAEQACEGVNALFFDPNDSAGLCDAIVKLVEDQRLREEYAKNSSALFQGLMQYDDMVDRYGEVLREAAASSPPMERAS